jgi:hypothetical protein
MSTASAMGMGTSPSTGNVDRYVIIRKFSLLLLLLLDGLGSLALCHSKIILKL